MAHPIAICLTALMLTLASLPAYSADPPKSAQGASTDKAKQEQATKAKQAKDAAKIKAKAEGRCLNPDCTAISQKKPDVKTGGSPTKEYDRRGNEITDAFKEGRATLPHSASQERAAKVAQEKEAAAKKNKEFSDRADAQRRTAELARAKSEENRLRIQAEGRAKVAAEQAAKDAAAKAAIAQKNKEMTDRADAQRRTAELARAKSEEKRRAQVKWGACMANKFTDCGPKPEL